MRFTGVPPNRIVVRRDHHGGSSLFDLGSWTSSYGGVCVEVSAATRSASSREVFSYPGDYDLTVYRGVPPNVDPRAPSCVGDRSEPALWWLIGRSPSGVVQYGALSWLRLFVLPDGTWIFTSERVARLLGPALAVDGRAPPPSDLEPSARLVQQDLGAGPFRLRRLLPQGLFARDAVVGRTVAESLGPAPGQRAEVSVKFHFTTEAQASGAADNVAGLLRSGAARDTGWSSPLPDSFTTFMRSVEGAHATGRTLVLSARV